MAVWAVGGSVDHEVTASPGERQVWAGCGAGKSTDSGPQEGKGGGQRKTGACLQSQWLVHVGLLPAFRFALLTHSPSFPFILQSFTKHFSSTCSARGTGMMSQALVVALTFLCLIPRQVRLRIDCRGWFQDLADRAGEYNVVPFSFTFLNAGVSSYSLLQGIFQTWESNPGLLQWRQILYHLNHQGNHLSTQTGWRVIRSRQKRWREL